MSEHHEEDEALPVPIILLRLDHVEVPLTPEEGLFVLRAFPAVREQAEKWSEWVRRTGELPVFDEELVAAIRDRLGITDEKLPRPVRDGIVIEYRDRFGFVSPALRHSHDAEPAPTVEEAFVLPSASFCAAFMCRFAPAAPYRLVYRSVALAEQDQAQARNARWTGE